MENFKMPVYEYECPSCQKIHEVSQKFADAPLSQCPECSSPVQKLISRSSFALKGSGFYTNDYKRTSQKPTEAPVCPSTGSPCEKAACK
jgi:putative FmdB family regulatory protein